MMHDLDELRHAVAHDVMILCCDTDANAKKNDANITIGGAPVSLVYNLHFS
jgi:hypothetical protein